MFGLTPLQIATVIGVPSICATLITTLVNTHIDKMKQKKGQRSAEALVLQALARIQLRELYNKKKAKGYTTYEDYEDFEALYNGYHADGGNGVMTTLFEQYKQFEIRED